MRRCFSYLFLICSLFFLCGCAGTAEEQFFAMDTSMAITLSGDDVSGALQESRAEIDRLEALLSRTEAASAVSALNRGETVDNEELCSLLRACTDYAHSTSGAFDVTIAPVVAAWGFTTDTYRVPTDNELAQLLTSVGSENIRIDGSAVSLSSGTQIDLGGIAKGYAADRIAALWSETGVTSGCANLGGSIYVRGTKKDGSLWRIAVRDPQNTASSVGVLSLSDAFAVTSGGYERYFTQNGQTYHHIIDPTSGYPAKSGLLSVTVVSRESGTLCDAFSTALFVLGEEAAIDLWRSAGGTFDLVLVTEDGRVAVTAGLADSFEEMEGSSYQYETIR